MRIWILAIEKIFIKKLHKNAIIPAYQTPGASGFDIFALEACVVRKNSASLIKTGLAISLPTGFELQIRSRSGLALRHKICVLNSPGTIDSDYRGEICVLLFNHGDADFAVNPKDRVAQGVLCRVARANFVESDELDATARGSGGFGSTGLGEK